MRWNLAMVIFGQMEGGKFSKSNVETIAENSQVRWSVSYLNEYLQNSSVFCFLFLTQEQKSRNVNVYYGSSRINKCYVGSFDNGILVQRWMVSSPLFVRSRLPTQQHFALKMQMLCKVGTCISKSKTKSQIKWRKKDDFMDL